MSARSQPFERFYDEHYDAVRRALSAAFQDAHLAEEAAQESFTRAYVHWRRVSEMERPDGWVYVVAVRYATRRRPNRTDDGAVATADPADEVTTRETLRRDSSPYTIAVPTALSH